MTVPSILLELSYAINTVWAIEYESPVPTVKVLAPVPMANDVDDVVWYLSPSDPSAPDVPDDPEEPEVPDEPDEPDPASPNAWSNVLPIYW